MPKFHNNSDNFLWKNGVLPVLTWFVVLIGGYLLFLFFHGRVTGLGNNIVTILWAIFTLYLLISWKRTGDKLLDSVHSWLLGYFGEWIARRRLLKLPDDYHVIYDFRIPGRKENIDFVVICKYGVFTVEVKKYLKKVTDIYKHPKNNNQAFRQARGLKRYLDKEGCGVSWVYPVLVYTQQDEYSPIKNTINDHRLYVLGKEGVGDFFVNSLAKNKESLSDEWVAKIANILDAKKSN